MSNVKKILFAVCSFVLIVSLLCSFGYSLDEDVKALYEWDSSDIAKDALNVGYVTEIDETTGNTVYKSILDISHLLFYNGEEDFNTVIVNLADIPDEDQEEDDDEDEYVAPPRLYYNVEDSGKLVDGNYCDPTYVNDGKTMIFRTYFPDAKNAIALNMDGEFSIESISVYMVESTGVSVAPNLIALGTLIVTLLLLLIFERKLGYFSWIIGKVSTEISLLRELARGKRLPFILHLCSLLFTSILFITVALKVAFNVLDKESIVLVFVVSILAVMFQLIDRIYSGRNATPAKLFLVIAILAGIMMCYTSPVSTHSAWDDEIHLGHAYYAGNFWDDEQSLAQYKMFSHNYRLSDYINDPTYFTKILAVESQIPLEFDFDSSHPYTLVSYSPMIAVSALLGLLQADMIKLLILCRFANLVAYCAILYVAIKKLKSGGFIFSAVCLMPQLIYLACSMSYDWWLTAWMTYAFAYVISVLQDSERKFTTSDIAKILLALFVACGAKSLYCVMLLPLLFISSKKFDSPKYAKRFRIITVLTIIVIVAILVLPGMFVYNFYSDPRGGENVSTMGQVVYILTHPIHFIKVMLTHLGEYCSLTRFNTYVSSFGYLDGYDGNPLPFFGTLAAILLGFSIITDRRDDDNYEGMQRIRWITLVTCIAQVAIMSASMYVAFNNVGSDVINGCQFRYTFPMFAVFFFFLRPKRILHSINEKARLSILYGGLAFNILFGYLCAYIDKVFLV